MRRSQALSPFGVGGIVDHRGESFVATDISEWRGAINVDAERIREILGISGVKSPPPAPDTWDRATILKAKGITFMRFPTWLFCGQCRRLQRWRSTDEIAFEPALCPVCPRHQLIPMRFVMVCGNGHLDDVDWHRWAHSTPVDDRQRGCRVRDSLRFRTVPGRGGGLGALEVSCDACRASRSLDRIAGPMAAKNVGMRCRGKQPWEVDGVPCDQDPVIVQKGASNVHFPLIASAIDIPPWSNPPEDRRLANAVRAHPMYQALIADPANRAVYEGLRDQVARECGVREAEIEAMLEEDRTPAGVVAHADDDPARVMAEEWKALVNPIADDDPRATFVSHASDLPTWSEGAPPPLVSLGNRLAGLARVTQLREVRVLTGFHRYDRKAKVKPDLGQGVRWLPGIEVFGEGIFVHFEERVIRSWESREAVVSRTSELRSRLAGSFLADQLEEPTPRFVMLHSLAHVLMRQLVFETGFSSAALRERLYVAADPEPMQGILIYTSAGDSEGSMGGLARHGFPHSLMPTMAKALLSADWCSHDPVCGESTGQGIDSLSLAACHGCLLVSETSCTSANALLDRRLLLGPDIGFFGDVIPELAGALGG